MSSQLLASKIIVVEEEPRVRAIADVQTAVAGFLGVTERGPLGVATAVTSPDEYESIFGGYVADGVVRQVVDGFFQNGGSLAYVARTAHYTDVTDPTTSTAAAGTASLPNATPVPTLKIDGKTPGTYTAALKAKVTDATSGTATEFNLAVVKNGLIVETFPNVTMDPTAANYVETVVNDPNTGSHLIAATDLAVVGTVLNARPANVLSAALAGGNDGLSGLTDADFTGASGADGKTGLRAFDTVQDLAILAVPGRATAAVHNAMITYCEVTRDMSVFGILDPPANLSATDVITYFETTAAVLGLSEFGAAYWPRIKVLNPAATVFGTAAQIVVPPSGHIAGVYARTDARKPGGVYEFPAGVDAGVLFGCLGFETDEVLEEGKRDLVYPKRINPLTTNPGSPRYIDGSRTLKGNGNFPSVAERRGAIFIEQSVKRGLQFARHKKNTEALRASVSRTVEAFLVVQMNNGAFRTTDPATAFFVDFGDGLNPASVQFAGKLVGRIGIATAKPAEFIVTRYSQDTRALEEELAA